MQNPSVLPSLAHSAERLRVDSSAPFCFPPLLQLPWPPLTAGRQVVPAPGANRRCSEKGCVFPAEPGGSGQCRQHQRQSREPVLFCSHQPTHVVLERVRFGTGSGSGAVDTSRSRDRKRLVELREAFLEE